MEKLSLTIKTDTFLMVSFCLFLLLLNFQMLGVGGWLEPGESSLKMYHLFGLLFIIPFFYQRFSFDMKKMGFVYIVFFMILVVVTAALCFPFYGFNTFIINYIFAFFLFFLGLILVDRLGEARILRAFQIVSVVVNSIILFKAIYYFEEIRSFLNQPYGHPSIYFIYGGGPNLESTWIALNTLFFINKKRVFYLFLVFSTFIAGIYASRVGIIMCVMVYFFYFFSSRMSKKERTAVVFILILTILFFGYYIIREANEIYVFKRFLNIGDKSELGSQGRLALYKSYVNSFSPQTLLGVGPGNAIQFMESTLMKDFAENNLHNYYLQVFLEFGILGFFAFLLVVADLIHKNIQIKLHNPFGIFILCYLIGCLIQFGGAESFVWLSIGIFYGCFYRKAKIGG